VPKQENILQGPKDNLKIRTASGKWNYCPCICQMKIVSKQAEERKGWQDSQTGRLKDGLSTSVLVRHTSCHWFWSCKLRLRPARPLAKTPPYVAHSKVQRCCVLGICIFISVPACVSVITTGMGLWNRDERWAECQLMTTASAYNSRKFQLFQQHSAAKKLVENY